LEYVAPPELRKQLIGVDDYKYFAPDGAAEVLECSHPFLIVNLRFGFDGEFDLEEGLKFETRYLVSYGKRKLSKFARKVTSHGAHLLTRFQSRPLTGTNVTSSRQIRAN
jgi:hypothetical protein